MAKRTVLAELPDISITVPVPDIPEGKLICVIGSSLQNAEKEFVLSILATAAAGCGKWCPVSAITFASLLRKGRWAIVARNVLAAVWPMQREGLLSVVSVNNTDYLIPTQKLAEVLNEGQGFYEDPILRG